MGGRGLHAEETAGPSQGADPPQRLPVHRTRHFLRKGTQLEDWVGALMDSTPSVSCGLGMTLPWFPWQGPEGLRLSDVQRHSGPPSSLGSHL